MPALKEAQDKVKALSLKALEVAESTTMTASEQATEIKALEADIVKWQAEVKNAEYVDTKAKQLRAALNPDVDPNKATGDQDGNPNPGPVRRAKSIGEQFVQSAQYKNLIGKWDTKGAQWSSGAIDLHTKGPSDANTIWEGMPSTTPAGTAGALVATPTVLPGIVDVRFPSLVVEDLIPGGETTTPLIRYLKEDPTTIVIGAAETAEGNAYPEAALTFTKADVALTKIPVFLPVTDEMLEDVSQIQSYINSRLQLFIRQRIQYQLLLGNGTTPNLNGLVTQATGTTVPLAGGNGFPASDNQMDAIYRQITNIRVTAFLEPDGIVMDPGSWQDITLAKTALGQYYANGPFMDQQRPGLWGKTVVSTPAMNGQQSSGLPVTTSAGQALVGAFGEASQLFNKGGLTVEATNSHSDFFTKGMTVIRAERRCVLIVYRPTAFGLVTGL
jgi:HK97 family phage major capsid protein